MLDIFGTMPQIFSTVPHIFGTPTHIFSIMLHIFSTMPHILGTMPHSPGLSLDFLRIFSAISHDFLKTFLWRSQNFLSNFDDFLRTFSEFSWDNPSLALIALALLQHVMMIYIHHHIINHVSVTRASKHTERFYSPLGRYDNAFWSANSRLTLLSVPPLILWLLSTKPLKIGRNNKSLLIRNRDLPRGWLGLAVANSGCSISRSRR